MKVNMEPEAMISKSYIYISLFQESVFKFHFSSCFSSPGIPVYQAASLLSDPTERCSPHGVHEQEVCIGLHWNHVSRQHRTLQLEACRISTSHRQTPGFKPSLSCLFLSSRPLVAEIQDLLHHLDLLPKCLRFGKP